MRAFPRGFPPRLRPGIGLAIGLLLAATGAADPVRPLGSRLAVCFPPATPVFGDVILDAAGPRREGHFIWSPPAELAEYVHETFYPALSTRLMARSFGTKLEARLEAYRQQRNTLINELADQLLSLQGVDEATREIELGAFAARQGPRIVALENEADELRQALIVGGLLQPSVDWNHHRRWRLGATRFENAQAEKEAEFQVIRSAAYYESGFSIEQRGLLLEEAVELQGRARAARPFPPLRTDDAAAIFFSPALSRLRLPANATPELQARVARFNRVKSDLKRALREAVFEQDRFPAEARENAFEALAERQWPQWIELEKLADAVRSELAVIPAPPLRAGPRIPAALSQRIEAYHRDQRGMIEDFEEAVRTAMDRHRARLAVRPSNEKERRELAQMLAEDRVSIRAKVAERIAGENRGRYDEVRRRHDAIVDELKVVALGKTDSETGVPLTAETLLRGHAAAEERFGALGREEIIYRGYRVAMLMPALSPEQRRLLFGFALVGLAQPLPPGESMPYGAQPTPRS